MKTPTIANPTRRSETTNRKLKANASLLSPPAQGPDHLPPVPVQLPCSNDQASVPRRDIAGSPRTGGHPRDDIVSTAGAETL